MRAFFAIAMHSSSDNPAAGAFGADREKLAERLSIGDPKKLEHSRCWPVMARSSLVLVPRR